MSHKMTSAIRSTEVNPLESATRTIDSLRPRMAKAEPGVNGSQSTVQDDQSTLRALIADVMQRVGSQKAAAIDMGIDQAQLTRQLQSGHLTIGRLESLPVEFFIELARVLQDTFAPLMTPASRLRRLADEIDRITGEMRQLSEFIA